MEAGMTGIVPAVVAVMGRFPEHLPLQRNAIRALANVAFGNDANRAQIGREGGAKAIVAAMRKHRGPLHPSASLHCRNTVLSGRVGC